MNFSASKNPFSDLGGDNSAVKPKPSLGAMGPAWTQGRIEAPRGTIDRGGWQSSVYTLEQQRRLGVDENGSKTATQTHTLGPPWTRGMLEAPKGERSTGGGGTERFYTVEQQIRLKVDDQGAKINTPTKKQALGPAWTRGAIEPPKGTLDMGSWNKRFYTKEQQHRLSVDEDGNAVPKSPSRPSFGYFDEGNTSASVLGSSPGGLTKQVSIGEFDPFAVAKTPSSGLTRQLSLKGFDLFKFAVSEDTTSNQSAVEESDSGEDDCSTNISRNASVEREQDPKEKARAEREWERKEQISLPADWQRDHEGNLQGSILERVTSKKFSRGWKERQFIVKKDEIIIIKTDAGKKGDARTIHLDDYTQVTAREAKLDGKDRYQRFKIVSKTPWGAKEVFLAQLGCRQGIEAIEALDFLRQELMQVL